MKSVKIMESLQRRDYSYDMLRCFSCLYVVILHVSAIYIEPEYVDLYSVMDYMIASFFRVITNLAVPSFVMLSGAFLIVDRNSDFRTFYKRSFSKILLFTIAFSIIYVIMHYAKIIMAIKLNITISGDKLDLFSPVINLINGKPHITMWYMYMIIPMYLVTPLIVLLKRNISVRAFRILAVIMLIYSIVVSRTCSLSWVLQFAYYVGYFFMGNMIRELWIELRNKYQKNNWNMLGVMLIFLSYFSIILYWYIFTYRTGEFDNPGNLSEIVVLATLLQFMGMSSIKVRKRNVLIQIISEYSLEIYLIHPIFLEVITQLLCRVIKWLPSAIGIPLYAGMVTIVCVVTWKCYMLLKKYMLNKILKKEKALLRRK